MREVREMRRVSVVNRRKGRACSSLWSSIRNSRWSPSLISMNTSLNFPSWTSIKNRKITTNCVGPSSKAWPSLSPSWAVTSASNTSFDRHIPCIYILSLEYHTKISVVSSVNPAQRSFHFLVAVRMFRSLMVCYGIIVVGV